MLDPMWCVVLSAVLFACGLAGVLLNRRHLLVLLMSLEVMLLGVNTNFITFAYWHQGVIGDLIGFFVLATAAAEVALGLAIIVLIYQRRYSFAVEDWHELQG